MCMLSKPFLRHQAMSGSYLQSSTASLRSESSEMNVFRMGLEPPQWMQIVKVHLLKTEASLADRV